jgi:hypothetical protein
VTVDLPRAAEWARTLAAGVVPGALRLAPAAAGERDRAFGVQHLTDPDGRLALLVTDRSPLDRRVRAHLDAGTLDDDPAVLDVLDVPPGQFRLPRARLCVTGWVQPLTPAEQRELAAAAAVARPVGALLGVGAGTTLYRLDPAEICVTTADGAAAVSEEEFVAARPDAMYEAEDGIVAHLGTHHRDRIIAYALRHLPVAEAAGLRDVSVAGLDRYGLDLQCATPVGYRTLRASFGAPVDGPDGFAARLCDLFGCPCAARVGQASAQAPRRASGQAPRWASGQAPRWASGQAPRWTS